MNIIPPTILRGTRDFLPAEMMRRNAAMDTIRLSFEQFGYVPIETPILSPAETILGKYGEEGDQLTYTFKDRGGRLVTLPYDLTVPFARFFAANYKELPIPFKRYQIQRVWRAEKPQKGRLREFYQCDIDIIGAESLLCEAEIAKMIVTVFNRLKIPNITIKVNSRRVMNAILESFNIQQGQRIAVIRVIDKIAKIGSAAVLDELNQLGVKDARRLLEILKPESTNAETLEKLLPFAPDELGDYLLYSQQLGVPEESILIDPTLARGLDYYTGLIFEVVSKDADFGTICAGGRYDNLCGLFSEQKFSGVGVAFGFERIMLLLDELYANQTCDSPSQVLVTLFDQISTPDALQIYKTLIEANIPAEIYFGNEPLAKQFKFADKKQIPFVLIQGPSEREKAEITVKRLQSGKQKTIPLNQLITYITNFYVA